MSDTVLTRLVGRPFLFAVGDGLTIRVMVLDARVRFTWREVLITPDDGSGQTWVPLSTIAALPSPPGSPSPDADALDVPPSLSFEESHERPD